MFLLMRSREHGLDICTCGLGRVIHALTTCHAPYAVWLLTTVFHCVFLLASFPRTVGKLRRSLRLFGSNIASFLD